MNFAAHVITLYCCILNAVLSLTPRVAVFGGSGFVGSEVSRLLVEAGVDLTVISRAGGPRVKQRWTDKCKYIEADMLSSSPSTIPLGEIDIAIACVGHMRPSPNWDGFFGLHYDQQQLELDNGLMTERIVEAAKKARAQRFVFVSLWSLSKYALYGALEGYVLGKIRGEEAARRAFPNASVIVSPHLIVGGKRFGKLGRILRAYTNNPGAKFYNKMMRGMKEKVSDFWPQDAISEIQNTPPSDVTDVARAVVAAALNVTLILSQEDAYSPDGGEVSPPPPDVIDGFFSIVQAAEQASDTTLKAAASTMGRNTKNNTTAAVTLPACDLPSDFVSAPTSHYSPNDGALFGAKPLLFPLAPALSVFGFFVALILESYKHAPPPT
ncbi:hypothetical protein TrCOL_g10121 [Triparma columacea]|uniref:NAD-dependent epimerase/dehydratase domain-containing protein n=1 Tax=Triparma columacea TaxID=722753 RepID=A0A9W7GD94_9STRA|nr:hypothetical protein TrCOL_g10121 [Triparma columacea]